MAKKSKIEHNTLRAHTVERYAKKRKFFKDIIQNVHSTVEERFRATLKLSTLPRNSAKVRVRNRCALSGRPRGFYRDFGLSRIALRELAREGRIPGLIKSSW